VTVTVIVDPTVTVTGPDDPLTCTVAAPASAGHSAMRKRTLARNIWVTNNEISPVS
jgi:hypothetical protein